MTWVSRIISLNLGLCWVLSLKSRNLRICMISRIYYTLSKLTRIMRCGNWITNSNLWWVRWVVSIFFIWLITREDSNWNSRRFPLILGTKRIFSITTISRSNSNRIFYGRSCSFIYTWLIHLSLFLVRIFMIKWLLPYISRRWCSWS